MGEGNCFSNVIAAQFVCATNNQAHNNTHTHIEHVQSIGFKKTLTTNIVLYQIFAPCLLTTVVLLNNSLTGVLQKDR